MDPAEEIRDAKRHKEYYDMVGYVCDSQYGIPKRCPCGERLIDEMGVKEEEDTHPGKRFFTCRNYEVRVPSADSFSSLICCLMFLNLMPLLSDVFKFCNQG